MKEQMASTDFRPYMNATSGIGFTWICPACDARVRGALGVVIDVFGPMARFVHLPSQIRKLPGGDVT